MDSNRELELAFKYIAHTSQNVFLTGKAGTGKTTFLTRVRKEVSKNMIVVAPTAVAAINAAGVTIHSQFNLPLGVCGSFVKRSESDTRRMLSFSKSKIALLRTLDLLVIDEISMVRCDILDAVDEVMRRYRDHSRPFGGVQVLVIGDVQQLAPVAVPAEMEVLKQKYNSVYFFDSAVFVKANFIPIELKKVYRQSDRHFVDLLQSIREGRVDSATLAILNGCYKPGYDFSDDGRVALTSHVHKADTVNLRMLTALKQPIFSYQAEVTGEFSEYGLPVDKDLKLKLGAQVMFVKNDSSQPMRYYNGKVGTITKIDENSLQVTTIDDNTIIDVVKEEWINKRYDVDADGKTEEVSKGTFKQYPLRLAWAITIHKSQGLTFDKVAIDAMDCFAHGQAYVALSRCRSFEGMLLTSQLAQSSFVSDTGVKRFATESAGYECSESHMEEAIKRYKVEVVSELLSFGMVSKYMNTISNLFGNNLAMAYPRECEALRSIAERFREKLIPMSEQLIAILTQHIFFGTALKNNVAMEHRIREGVVYFKDNFMSDANTFNILSNVDIDNKEVGKRMKRQREEMGILLNVKNAVFEMAADEFSIEGYFTEKRKSITKGLSTPRKSKAQAIKDLPSNIYEPTLCDELYDILSEWRRERAANDELEAYRILPNLTLRGISDRMPQDERELFAIHGMGKIKVALYKDELLEIVSNFADENNLNNKIKV